MFKVTEGQNPKLCEQECSTDSGEGRPAPQARDSPGRGLRRNRSPDICPQGTSLIPLGQDQEPGNLPKQGQDRRRQMGVLGVQTSQERRRDRGLGQDVQSVRGAVPGEVGCHDHRGVKYVTLPSCQVSISKC